MKHKDNDIIIMHGMWVVGFAPTIKEANETRTELVLHHGCDANHIRMVFPNGEIVPPLRTLSA